MVYLPSIAALVFGIMCHIAKKAMKLRQQDSAFDLSDYLAGHPYQTFLTVAAAIGCYFSLINGGVAPSLEAAFLAGVAANSLGDLAPGNR